MKVVLAVDALTPPLSGIGRYTWELANRLTNRPEVDSLGFYMNGYWVKDPATMLVPSAPGEKPEYKRLAGILSATKWLRKTTANIRCRNALFHGPNFFLPPCADTGVITVHDLSVLKYPETHPAERIRHYEMYFAGSIDRASHLITVSQTTRQEVIDYLGVPENRVTCVYNGVSDNFQTMSVETLQPILPRHELSPGGYSLCVSTLDPRKRIDRLIDAYALLPADLRHRFPLILVGPSGWLNEELNLKIAEATRAGWLKYLGFVPEEDLPYIFAGARLFIYPSIYEGFGLPVVESMASGVPVITSKFSCLPEVSQGAALLIDPDDIEHFSTTIQQGLTDDEWRSTAIMMGLSVAQKYRWERCVEDTLSVYHAAINNS